MPRSLVLVQHECPAARRRTRHGIHPWVRHLRCARTSTSSCPAGRRGTPGGAGRGSTGPCRSGSEHGWWRWTTCNDSKRQGSRSTIAALLLVDGRPCLISHSEASVSRPVTAAGGWDDRVQSLVARRLALTRDVRSVSLAEGGETSCLVATVAIEPLRRCCSSC